MQAGLENWNDIIGRNWHGGFLELQFQENGQIQSYGCFTEAVLPAVDKVMLRVDSKTYRKQEDGSWIPTPIHSQYLLISADIEPTQDEESGAYRFPSSVPDAWCLLHLPGSIQIAEQAAS